jgi:hypothetical protein
MLCGALKFVASTRIEKPSSLPRQPHPILLPCTPDALPLAADDVVFVCANADCIIKLPNIVGNNNSNPNATIVPQFRILDLGICFDATTPY